MNWDDFDYGRQEQEEADRHMDREIAIAQVMADDERNADEIRRRDLEGWG
jgi:hypothetical protein